MTKPAALTDTRRFELLINAVVDYAIYMIDPEGRVMSWNPGAERLKGYTAAEIVGEIFHRFYTDEDQAAGVPDRALRIAREEGRYEAEGWRVRKDGSRFWALVVIDPIRDDDQLLGFAKVTRDMTERREAQRLLLESERRFRLLVEGVTDYAIYMLDADGRITNWNAGAQRFKGYTFEEIVGHHFSEFYTPEDREAGVPTIALETARAEGRYEAEGWRVRKDGTRFWANVVIDAIRNEAGDLIGFAKITRDVTEQRDAALRLEETREQLYQAQKMDALGQLTGGLAHDFNNLLTAILGSAELGLRYVGDNPRLSKMLDNIRASAQRGGALTRQLLAFARRQPLAPTSVNLNEQLPVTAALLRHSLRADIDLISEISDQTWQVEADPGQLELALLNLGFNARDAMPTGGTLRIGARNVTLDGDVGGLTGDFVAISVTDTGSGMPLEIRDRVFEPFFTTKPFGQGTGLGLSQVYGFAKQSNGTVTIDSEVGRGTAVTLYLPARSAVPSEPPIGHGSPAARVLVVEDDPNLAELAADIMRELDYEPVVVHGAADALAAINRGDDFQLVFSDVVMPGGISGMEMARRMRLRRPELPILLTSGYSETATAAGGPEFPLLLKPYELNDLRQAIELLAPNPVRRDQPAA
jgi:PAS domain S-box-containing protein